MFTMMKFTALKLLPLALIASSSVFALDCESFNSTNYFGVILNIRQKMGDSYANSLLLKCAREGNANLAYIVSTNYGSGLHGFEKNDSKSMYWLKKAAVWGNKDPKDSLALAYIDQGNYVEALRWSEKSIGNDWQRVCSKYPYKEFNFDMGLNTQMDKEGDITTVEQRCRTLDKAIAGYIDQRYQSTIKSIHDPKKVDDYLVKYAKLGSVHAQIDLAFLLMKLSDKKRELCLDAVKFYNMAQKNYAAKKTRIDTGRIYYGLSLCYERLGQYKASNTYTFYLARMGDIDAMLKLATTYSQGLGVPQNYVKAYAWASVVKSMAYGHNDLESQLSTSIGLLARLTKEMSPDEVNKAQEYASKLYGT